MKYEELDNLSRGERFEKIKALCRSQAIIGLCIAVVILLAFTGITYTWRDLELKTALFFLLTAGCVLSGWMAVNNLWFLYRQGSLDMPEQLLHCYEKRFKNDRNVFYLVVLALFIGDPSLWFDITHLDRIWALTRVMIVVAMIALLIYSYFNDDILWRYVTRRDEEIFDRLEDLVEKK